jgi:kinetochore protein Mis12/MTW1
LVTSGSSTEGENPFAFLNAASTSTKELKDTAAFAVSQIQLIRSLVDQLKPKYADLQQQRQQELQQQSQEMDIDGDNSRKNSQGKGTPDEERKKYIERMTRRHMEASRGLRLNAKGEVVGGDFEESIARKGLGEVEELEGLVEEIGKGHSEP